MTRFLKMTLVVGALLYMNLTTVNAQEPGVASSTGSYAYCAWLKKEIQRTTNPSHRRSREEHYRVWCGFPRPELTKDNPCRYSCRDSNGQITEHTESSTLSGGNFCEFLCETKCPRLGLTCARFQIRQPMSSDLVDVNVDTASDAPYLEEGDVYDQLSEMVETADQPDDQSK